MADISITRNHNLDMETLKKRVEELALDLNKKYSLTSSWSGNTCTLSGAGIKKAEVVLKSDAVNIDITLGMLAKMLKPQIEDGINKKIGSVLS